VSGMKTTAAALLVVTSMTAQAAEPETLTLACNGTVTDDDKPEPVSMGIVVDFANRTVQDFLTPGDGLAVYYPVNITGWDDVTVSFRGSGSDKIGSSSIRGTMDRVTGDVSALLLLSSDTNKLISALKYGLKCTPAQRKF